MNLPKMFYYKSWEFFAKVFPLKTLCDYLCFKKYLQNTSKNFRKACDMRLYTENKLVNKNSVQPQICENIFKVWINEFNLKHLKKRTIADSPLAEVLYVGRVRGTGIGFWINIIAMKTKQKTLSVWKFS